MSRKVKIVTLNVTIPNPTANGAVIDTNLNLDANYDLCTGYAVQVLNDAPQNFELGLRNSEDQIQELVFFKHLTTSTAVAIKDRYHDINVVAQGRQITAQVKALTDITTEINLQFIFRLENKAK